MTRGQKIATIFVVIFVVIGGIVFWIHNSLSKAETELNAIAQPMIEDLAVSHWNQAVFDKYASPKMKEWMQTNKLTNGMPGLDALGDVKEYDGVQTFTMNENFALLMAKVKFDSGDAEVRLQLCKCDGKWLMDGVFVNSPTLMQSVLGGQNAK